jgi:hypothetical protein
MITLSYNISDVRLSQQWVPGVEPYGIWCYIACKADNLTAIREPTVYRKCGSLDIWRPHGPSRPVTVIALPLPTTFTLNYRRRLQVPKKHLQESPWHTTHSTWPIPAFQPPFHVCTHTKPAACYADTPKSLSTKYCEHFKWELYPQFLTLSNFTSWNMAYICWNMPLTMWKLVRAYM